MESNQAGGSYIPGTFSENIESEVNRLRYQVDLFYSREFEIYKKLGLKDGMKIVECGSGPGFLITNIKRDLPGCIATAVEIDPYLVEHLKRNSEDNGKMLIEVKHASIYKTELPDNSFDFAIARLVFEHLTQPADAISEIRRILKPGGTIVIVSNDFSYHLLTFPAINESDEMFSSYINSRLSKGGNPFIGRQMPVFLKNGGFEELNIEIICVHNEIDGDKPFLKAENVNISKSLVKEGFLKKETLENLVEGWYKILQYPGHVLFRQLFVSSGTKKGRNAELMNDINNFSNLASSLNRTLNSNDLIDLTRTEQEDKLGMYLIAKMKAIMEQPDLVINNSTILRDIDIDSITAAEISGIIKSDFGTSLSIADILQKDSISDIINAIINNLNSPSSQGTKNLKTEPDSNWIEGEL